jgi:hypothetical protein
MHACLSRARRAAQTAHMLLVLIAIPLVLIWALTVVDVLRRHDLRTSSKVLWALVVLLIPVFGVIAYLVARPPDPVDRFAPAEAAAPHADPALERVREQHPV